MFDPDLGTPVEITPGETSYFSGTEMNLDPALFDGMRLRSDVRSWVNSTLLGYLGHHYNGASHWCTAWIAGSGASYQWSAAREPGDLDILLGVDYLRFRQDNSEYAGLSDVEISDMITGDLRRDLWPVTANAAPSGGKRFEVTWYVNAEATDIRTIHPYAAYNVTKNEWTVPPDPNAHAPHNPEWAAKASQDAALAGQIVGEYNHAMQKLSKAMNPVDKRNAEVWRDQAADHAQRLLDDIHLGRRAAFGPGGQGYSDWHNYRWQYGKSTGAIQALLQIKGDRDSRTLRQQQDLYGQKLPDVETLLIRAMTHKRPQ